MNNQSGIAQLLIMFLLIAGIAVGTYLVGQRTNLLPKASENTCTYSEFCDAGSGPGSGTWTCTGTNPNEKGELQCGFNSTVQPNCSVCVPNSSGSQNSGNGTQPAGTHVCSKDAADFGQGVGFDPLTCDQSNGCKGLQYHHFVSFTDTNGNGQKDPEDTYYCNYSSCQITSCPPGVTPPSNPQPNPASEATGSAGQGTTVTGGTNPCRDNPVTPPQGSQWVADCNKSCTDKSACPLPNPVNPNIANQDDGRWCFGFDGGNKCMVLKAGTSLTCNGSVATSSYFDTKVATNLAFYEGILRGAPNTCVKADLGLDPHIYAHAQSGGSDERRLFLCGGVNNKPGSLDLTWRVLSDDAQTLVLTKENFPLNPSDAGWPNNNQATQARNLLGVASQ